MYSRTRLAAGAILALATFTGGTMAAVAAPTAAPSANGALATNVNRCPKANFCIFEHKKGGGRYGATYHYKKNLSDVRVWSGYMNDKTSSVRVNRAEPWCVYEHANYQGNKKMLMPNTTYDFTGDWWNDRISSFKEAERKLVRLWPAKYDWRC